jgi:hypothetical protein
MQNVWLASSVWIGLALAASIISIRVAISVALIEIIVGAIAGNIIGLEITPWVQAKRIASLERRLKLTGLLP